MFDKMEKSTIIAENDKYILSRRSFVWKIEKFDGIGCFIEDFIEQVHQSGMLNKKTGKTRDRKKLSCIIQQMDGYL